MGRQSSNFITALAAGAMTCMLGYPAFALDVGASIGGVSASASVGKDSDGGLGASASASIGGSGGIKADVDASIGGTTGTSASVGIGVGGTTTGGSTPPGVSPTTPGGALLANLSPMEVARLKKRCTDVLASPTGFDRDLVELCRMVSALRR